MEGQDGRPQVVLGTTVRLLGLKTLTREQKLCQREEYRAVLEGQPGVVVRGLRNDNVAILRPPITGYLQALPSRNIHHLTFF